MLAQVSPPGRARSWSWIASAGTLLVVFLLFLNGNHVGNNFDTNRYYTVVMVLPAICTTLACVVLQRIIDHRVMLAVLSAYEAIVLAWYSMIALDFQSWNGDALVYITSYMFVYHGGIYAAVLAGALPLAYLAFIDRVPGIKERRAAGQPVIFEVLQDAAWIVAIAIGALLIAKYLALGTSHLALAAGIGVCLIHDALAGRYPTSLAAQEPLGKQSSSKAKNALVVLSITFASLALAYLWSISHIRIGDDFVAIYDVDGHDVIGDNMLGLVIFEAIAIVVLATGIGRKKRVASIVYEEAIYAGFSVAFLAVEWALVMAGTRVFPVRAPLLLTPLAAVFGLSWLATATATRERESGGLLGAAWTGAGATTWLAFCLSTSPDLDGLVYIITGLVIATAVMVSLVVGIINPRFVVGRQGRSVPVRRIVGWPREGNRLSTALRGRGKALAIVAVVCLAAMPAAFTVAAAASPAQFQLLANVNDDCIFYLADPMTRVAPEYQPYFGIHGMARPNPNITVSAAKGEYEPVQVVMKPVNQDHFTVYTVTFSDMVHAADPGEKILSPNWTAYTVEPVAPLSNVIQDMLVPFNRYTVSDGMNHPFWFVFHVPRTALDGDYLGTITMEVDNKTENPLDWNPGRLLRVDFPVVVTVFNFTLPDSPTLKSNFGFPESDPAFDTVVGWFQERRMMHWSHVALPRATLDSYGNVTAIDSASLDAAMGEVYAYGTRTIGMHASSFKAGAFLPTGVFVVDSTPYVASSYATSPRWNETTRQYVSMLEAHLKSKTYIDSFGTNVSWFDDVYLTGYDEVDARGEAEVSAAIRVYTWLKGAANTTLPIMQTMGHNSRLEAVVDIICFHTAGHEQEGIRDFLSASPAHDVWIYTTCGPRFPHPTIATYGMATQSRALAWQCFIYGYSQYLIWDVATPWNAGNGYGYQGWNGGSLLYAVPGGYALSTRIEMIREGFEDYEYFTLLARAPASTQRSALLDRVTDLMEGYVPSEDYRSWRALRADIGAFLSA